MQMNKYLYNIKYLSKSNLRHLQYNGINLVSTGFYKDKLHVFKKIPNKHLNKYEIEILDKGLPYNVPLIDKISDVKNTYLVFPYYKKGDLFENFLNKLPISEEDTKKSIKEMIKISLQLQDAGYVHLDLKLENFIIDDNNNYRLIDFGSSLPYHENKLYPFNGVRGTNGYLSPEVALNMYNKKSDVWSLGIIIHNMIVGHSLYSNVFEYVSRNDKFYLENMSEEGNDLLVRMLEKNTAKRISLKECIDHVWFKI